MGRLPAATTSLPASIYGCSTDKRDRCKRSMRLLSSGDQPNISMLKTLAFLSFSP